MTPAPTDDERRKLKAIQAIRQRAVLVIVALVPFLLVVSRFTPNVIIKMTLAVGAVAAGLGILLYLSFGLRCPRCRGWISMPKCPSCGLALERSTKT